MNKNIFGEPLITCSTNPMTGFFRNGCCDTDKTDLGMHTVCVIVTKEFGIQVRKYYLDSWSIERSKICSNSINEVKIHQII